MNNHETTAVHQHEPTDEEAAAIYEAAAKYADAHGAKLVHDAVIPLMLAAHDAAKVSPVYGLVLLGAVLPNLLKSVEESLLATHGQEGLDLFKQVFAGQMFAIMNGIAPTISRQQYTLNPETGVIELAERDAAVKTATHTHTTVQ